ncbi:hypothetical protein [Streptomyces sp. NBC_01264]|uniref:hypothetical protein n=1 Tax=Streptomyces sp. NBC_01264 TaxID=2903804 RepID=UPI0022571632|nr:hypothetical protein [Streptomyces sp. NBC_01264]MCX4783358.1 hypothetical protein [Streptomyces sp. NBC_01264]
MSTDTVSADAAAVAAEPVNPYGLPADMTPAQAVAALTRRPGTIPAPGVPGVPLMLPAAFVGPVTALQIIGFAPSEKRPRLDLRVRHLDEAGHAVEDGLRRAHHVHLLRQLGGLRRGEWTVGRFERMARHGAQWQALPHRVPARIRART